MKSIVISAGVLVVLLLALMLLRWLDERADDTEWRRLVALQPRTPARFDPTALMDLPEPAQRFFGFSITPETPLFSVVEIEMRGQFSLGCREVPEYRPMKARQVLAVPHGFVWRVSLPGWVSISGSDAGSPSESWTRFRILGFVPVARVGNDLNHLRSAYGRYVAEAVFWTPGALLPGPGVKWEGVESDTARVTVSTGALSQAVDVTVNAQGQPTAVSFMRWSNANPEEEYRLQPFGGTLSDFRLVQGFRLPFRVEAGNFFGTDDYFPFFKAEVTEVRFPEFGR